MDSSTLLPLIGIPVVVIGFALRFNPLLVVVVAGLATGLLVGMDFGMLLETFGEKFVNSRSLATFILILPVIGLLEYYGLKERAQAWVAKIASATSAPMAATSPETTPSRANSTHNVVRSKTLPAPSVRQTTSS